MTAKTAILAIESSTLTASVALLVDNEVAIERESGVNTHSEALLTLIDECLRSQSLSLEQLQAIAIGAGPGSFTGLRIGMATVKGLCFAMDLPLTPVSSLAALALDGFTTAQHEGLWHEKATVLAVLDARRKEVYAARFSISKGVPTLLDEERVVSPAALAEEMSATSGLILCGDGARKYKTELASIGHILESGRATPSAAAVGRLASTSSKEGERSEMLTAAPTYVRLPEAQIKFPQGNPGGTFSVANATARPALPKHKKAKRGKR